MTKRIMVLGMLLLMSLAASCVSAAGFTIVKDGRPAAGIVVDEKPSEVAKAAARDLQEYLKEMSGATLPIVRGPAPKEGNIILVGRSPMVEEFAGRMLSEENVGYDGYVLRTFYRTYESARIAQPDVLVLAGRGDGTRFAVFALLEKLGCRFFHPGPYGEHIPRQKTMSLEYTGIASKPDFSWRNPYPSGSIEGTYGKYTNKKAWQAWKSWRIKNKLGGKGLDIGHNFQAIVPKSLFNEHPEYFSLAKPGTKLFEVHASEEAKTAGKPVRIPHLRCLSNPEVLKIATEWARKVFQRGSGSCALSPDDASRYMWCQCDACKAMDGPNDNVNTRMLRFANQVAEALEDEFPDRLLPFYCEYGIPGGPPANADGSLMLKAHPMVVPVPVNVYCRLHNINDPGCSYSFRWPLAVWGRVAKQIYIRGYRMWSRYPAPGTWTAGPLVRHYRDSGAKGYSCEILNRSPDNDLAIYIIAKMLWDSDQDPDALVEEYFRLYFQEAAPEMKDYYHCLNNSVLKNHRWHNDSVFEQASVFDDDLVSRLGQSLRKAERKAKQIIVKHRIKRERLALTSFDYLRRVEQSYIQWTQDKDPQKARKLDVLIDKALKFTERLDGKYIVNQEGQRHFYTSWRKQIDGK